MSEEKKTNKQIELEILDRVMAKFGCGIRAAGLALGEKVWQMTKTEKYTPKNMLAAEPLLTERDIDVANEDLRKEWENFKKTLKSPFMYLR